MALLIRGHAWRPSPQPRRARDLVGSTIAERFELLAFAGAGGMGRVYRARDTATGSTVAVKLLPDGGDSARFAREAEVLAGIDHPGVVRYLAHGTAPDGASSPSLHPMMIMHLTQKRIGEMLFMSRQEYEPDRRKRKARN